MNYSSKLKYSNSASKLVERNKSFNTYSPSLKYTSPSPKKIIEKCRYDRKLSGSNLPSPEVLRTTNRERRYSSSGYSSEETEVTLQNISDRLKLMTEISKEKEKHMDRAKSIIERMEKNLKG